MAAAEAPPPSGSSGPRTAPSPSAAPAPAAAAGPVLPWMRLPISVRPGSGVPIGEVRGLDGRLADALRAGFRFTELFPVQCAVWRHSGGGASTAHDLCVAAPTGSGKTLAYALPVINALAEQRGRCSLHCLQALVVLPTHDLAAQVYDVFRPLCAAVGLRAALAAARGTVAAEAAGLVGDADGGGDGGSHAHALRGGSGGGSGAGGCADLVIATPGRLMAHLEGTPGFTLRHLRFLVVDETDRLLRQSYQEWLPRVLAQLSPGRSGGGGAGGGGAVAAGARAGEGPPGGGGDPGSHFASCWPHASRGAALPYGQPRAVKIVVSATLTRDPSKLQRLALHHPRFVAASGGATAAAVAAGAAGTPATAAAAAAAAAAGARYSLPRSLTEQRLLCSAARKPLALLALLRQAAGQRCIVFSSSLEMTHKLFLLLRAVPSLPERAVEYSSMLPPRERAASLDTFRSGSARVLVASDAMTRGMDVEGVQLVINYDAPVYAKTYVHRAGRTARAGKSGRVVTLLRDQDMRHFKAMLRKADNNYVAELKLPPEALEAVRPDLTEGLAALEALLAAERAADENAAGAAATTTSAAQQQQQQQRRGLGGRGGCGTEGKRQLRGAEGGGADDGAGLRPNSQQQHRAGGQRGEGEGQGRKEGGLRLGGDGAASGGGEEGAGRKRGRKAAADAVGFAEAAPASGGGGDDGVGRKRRKETNRDGV